ncbi:hypothetical protein EMPG_13725 [Blastomyces silverae]|uniref:Uncharacterized protein n=1 Tax=Blastomyces silverae TaxID=2060906 RepID=A0A0H1BI29_9EURO|nr:hypothetical protein EMPG_13725 [Blastomyces silverae]
MTNIAPRSDAVAAPHLSSEMSFSSTRQIQMPNNSTSCLFTDATIIKAAWSLVLGRLPDSSYAPSASVASADVIFGGFVSTRNTSVDVTDVKWDPVDVPRPSEMCIHDQQIANISFENVGFGKILQSTGFFSSYVQHQNIDTRNNIVLGDTRYEIGGYGAERDFADVVLFSQPISNSQANNETGEVLSKVDTISTSTIDITIKYAWDRVPTSLAEKLLDAVCSEIQAITSAPEKYID